MACLQAQRLATGFSSWSKELDPYRERADTRAPGLSILRQLSTTERIAPIFGPAWFSWETRLIPSD
jgi:hypothetical protein